MTKTRLILGFFVYSLKDNCSRTLRPIISNNASPSRITAAAGTKISQDFFCTAESYFALLEELYEQRPFIIHGILLDKAFAHCPMFCTDASKEGARTLSQFLCGRPFTKIG